MPLGGAINSDDGVTKLIKIFDFQAYSKQKCAKYYNPPTVLLFIKKTPCLLKDLMKNHPIFISREGI